MLRVLRQIGLLVGASAFSAACGILGLALNTRGLGAERFGVLSLILAYSGLFAGIATFETWQSVIRLGMRAPRALGITLSAGIALDASAAIAAATASILGTFLFAQLTGIPDEYLALARLHALSLLGGVAGTPKGYFRLIERFDILAGNQVALAMATALASVALWCADARLATYVVTFAAISAAYNLSLMVRMLVMLRGSDIRLKLPFTSPTGRKVLRMMIRAVIGTSLISTLSSNRRNLSLLIVGGLLGEVAAGLLSVAVRLASAVSKFSSLALQVLFKTVLETGRKQSYAVWRQTVMRATALAATAALSLAAAGFFGANLLITVSFGAAFAAAAPAFAGLFGAECAGLATLLLNPVIQQKKGPRPLVMIAAVGLAIHLIATTILSLKFGVTGAGIAALVAALAGSGLMLFEADRLLRRSIAGQDQER